MLNFSANKNKCSAAEELSKYLPIHIAKQVSGILDAWNVDLKITKSRSSKYGDYVPPVRKLRHRITINNDLNQHAFLITLLHEIAHMYCWKKYRRRIKPHGKEWKEEFRLLLVPYLNTRIFPKDVKVEITRYIANPKASSCSDIGLHRVLSKYDAPSGFVHLETLEEGVLFQLRNGKVFKKGPRKRTRFVCKLLPKNEIYYVPAIQEVIPLALNC